jgi:nucleotide-binding universal stress UspA family protein
VTILVGYPTNRRAKAVLNLAGMLARSSGDDIVVCTVLPIPWVPGVARDDPKFRTYAQELADTALAHAREDMPGDVTARFTTIHAKSAPTGLLEAAEQCNAGTIVVGSAMGVVERVTVSSIADRLLHSSPIPVAVSTRGFRAGGDRVKRVTLGFTGGPQGGVLIAAAQALADQLGADLRLASFAVQLSPPETARFRTEGNVVIAEWTETILAAAKKDAAPGEGADRKAPEIVIGYGDDWEEALDDIDWAPGDLLVIGSSDAAPAARVFLGSRATQVLRHTPVPIIAVPRAAASELSDDLSQQ